MGQRSIAQLRLLDFTMAKTLGNIIAHPLSDEGLGLKGSMITMSVLIILYLLGVLLTIRVTQEGAYYVDYHVNGNFSPFGTGNNTMATAIFVNGAEVNPIQTRYGAFNNEVDRNECEPISGGTIVFIPANGTVQLRNVGASFRTCDGGFFVAASINLIKIN